MLLEGLAKDCWLRLVRLFVQRVIVPAGMAIHGVTEP
jgi:hypothetical protein